MRRSYLFIVMILLAGLTGCKGAKSPFKSMSQMDYETVKTVNDAQGNTVQAAKVAFGNASFTSTDNKVQRTADTLRQGNCQPMIPQPEDLHNDFQRLWQISGSKCPIFIHQTSTFNTAERLWTTVRDITVQPGDLQALNGLKGLSFTGNMKMQPFTNGSKQLSGVVNFNYFEVLSVKNIHAAIAIVQQSNGLHGHGSVTLTLQAANMRCTAAIDFGDSVYSAVFRVNGEETDLKTFNETFSSFELAEIMDRAIKMRY